MLRLAVMTILAVAVAAGAYWASPPAAPPSAHAVALEMPADGDSQRHRGDRTDRQPHVCCIGINCTTIALAESGTRIHSCGLIYLFPIARTVAREAPVMSILTRPG